jgi:hypothetical protein
MKKIYSDVISYLEKTKYGKKANSKSKRFIWNRYGIWFEIIYTKYMDEKREKDYCL